MTVRFRVSKFLMLNATFGAIFKHCVTERTWTEKLQNFVCPFSGIFSWNPSQGLRWNSTKNCLCRASVIEDYWSLYYETPCNCNATRVCIWNFGHPNYPNPMRDKNSQAANGSVMICLCHNFDRNVFLKSDLMAWIHF